MPLTFADVPLQIEGVKLNLSTIHNFNTSHLVLFLHGFGSSKEDLADLTIQPSLKHHGFLAYDAPGCGHSASDDLSVIDIPFLVATAEAMLVHFQISKFHIMGHSMGGLTALLLASRHPERVLSFVDIKGNIAPEDCFLSRQIFTFPTDDEEAFMDAFIERTRASGSFANAMYASTLRARVRAGAVRPIFKSMVHFTDHGDLIDKFLALDCPRMFMFGEEMRGLSYLPLLEREGVELADIVNSGHFPMYSNPVEMYRRITMFLNRCS
jgi:pimeloyl-ACP methyl ester carboxylesterase